MTRMALTPEKILVEAMPKAIKIYSTMSTASILKYRRMPRNSLMIKPFIFGLLLYKTP